MWKEHIVKPLNNVEGPMWPKTSKLTLWLEIYWVTLQLKKISESNLFWVYNHPYSIYRPITLSLHETSTTHLKSCD